MEKYILNNYKIFCVLDMAFRKIELKTIIFRLHDFSHLVNHCISNGWLDYRGIITLSGQKKRLQLMRSLRLRGIYCSIYPDFSSLYASPESPDELDLP